MRASKKNVKEKDKSDDKAINGWGAAITDAEKMILAEKRKIICLRQAIRAFKELLDAGEPFPGESVTQTEETSQ